MIKLDNVSKLYKKFQALSDFSYSFKEGSSYGLLGINGAGKSTLIGCIVGNLSFLGEITYEDIDISQIGYVPQELAIYPELTVFDNLKFFASVYKMKKEDIKKRAEYLMRQVGLYEKADSKAKDLSGGMKRKLNLVTALMHNPKFLICDEVCVGIDPISRDEILKYIKSLQNEGMTIIYTSHYLDEVEFLCDNIIFLNEGKILLSGRTPDIVKDIDGKEDASLKDVFLKVLNKED